MENKEIKEKKKVKINIKKEDEKLKQENIELNDKVMRLSAEMQNMRRRYDEEISKLCKYDGESIIEKILPIVDNFERAIKLDDNNLTDELSKFLSGFKMIYASLIAILNENGIVEIDAINKEFDPKTMEAILTDSDPQYAPNIVLDVMQKGYMYKDKLLRPAMVKVNEEYSNERKDDKNE